MIEQVKETKFDPLALRSLFGPAPVLRSEDPEHYEKIFAAYAAAFRPRDVLELTLLMRLVDATWFIIRYSRHQTVAIERWHRQGLEFQVQRIKLQNQRRQALARDQAQKAGQSPADIAHLVALEDNLIESVSDVDEILNRTPTELEHNRALEKGMLFQEQLDRLITSAWAFFESALELFEHYRDGLGQHLRQIGDQILEGEYKEIETTAAAPPLAPFDQGTNELDTQNNSERQQ